MSLYWYWLYSDSWDLPFITEPSRSDVYLLLASSWPKLLQHHPAWSACLYNSTVHPSIIYTAHPLWLGCGWRQSQLTGARLRIPWTGPRGIAEPNNLSLSDSHPPVNIESPFNLTPVYMCLHCGGKLKARILTRNLLDVRSRSELNRLYFLKINNYIVLFCIVFMPTEIIK